MQPSLPSMHRLALGAGGLALDGPASVPTQAKRDADGLAVDARTFLSDARAVVASVDNEPVFEPELAEEAAGTPAALAPVSLMSRARKRTARPATFPLDPRTAPPRIWRLLSDHMARTPYG